MENNWEVTITAANEKKDFSIPNEDCWSLVSLIPSSDSSCKRGNPLVG